MTKLGFFVGVCPLRVRGQRVGVGRILRGCSRKMCAADLVRGFAMRGCRTHKRGLRRWRRSIRRQCRAGSWAPARRDRTGCPGWSGYWACLRGSSQASPSSTNRHPRRAGRTSARYSTSSLQLGTLSTASRTSCVGLGREPADVQGDAVADPLQMPLRFGARRVKRTQVLHGRVSLGPLVHARPPAVARSAEDIGRR